MKINEAIQIVEQIEQTFDQNRDFMVDTGQYKEKIEDMTNKIIALDLVLKELRSYIRISNEDQNYHTHS
jgi:hypothetical protein